MRRRTVLVSVGLLLLVVQLLAGGFAVAGAELEEDDEDDDFEDFDEDTMLSGTSKEAVRAQKALPQVTDRNAERILNSTEYVLLLAYASWCKQSAATMVDFAQAAAVLSAKGSPVALAKLDAIANPKTAGRYNIRGYPTILFLVNGTAEIFSSGITRDEFVNWVLKRTGELATTFDSVAEAENLQNRGATVVIGLFEKFEGSEYEEFKAASSVTEDIEFLQTTNVDAAKVFSADFDGVAPAVGVWKSEPEKFLKFGGQMRKADLVAFIALAKYPLVTKLHARNVGRIYQSPLKKQVLLFASSDDYEDMYSFYSIAAKEFKDEIFFLWVDFADEEFTKPMITMYGISDSEPSVAGFDNSNGSRYLMESDVTIDNIKDFAINFKEGRLKLHYKSEPIPKKSKADVKVVVGKTFEKLVLKNPKDVLLLVSTPYCHECEALGKTFVKLAKHFREVPSIVFSKIDGSVNEHPDLKVGNYPAILLYRQSDKHSTPVQGPTRPSLKKLIQFVEDNYVKLLSASEDSNSETPSTATETEVVKVTEELQNMDGSGHPNHDEL